MEFNWKSVTSGEIGGSIYTAGDVPGKEDSIKTTVKCNSIDNTCLKPEELPAKATSPVRQTSTHHLMALTLPTTIPEPENEPTKEFIGQDQLAAHVRELTESLPLETILHSPVSPAQEKLFEWIDKDKEQDSVVEVIPLTPKTQLQEAFKFVEAVQKSSSSFPPYHGSE